MELYEDLVSIHAYLCADGYVVKNPPTQKHKYYRIGFRNTNLVLLKDFQYKFEKYFKIKPRLVLEERCEIGSKEIYNQLNEEFGSFYSWHWKMPNLNKELSKIWLRSYFDCEGWVFCKKHQNRHIGIDCVNEEGINQIISSLNRFKIKSIKKYNKNRKIYRLFIYGKENITLFKREIGFLHPDKKDKLDKTINDFVDYIWNFPETEEKCKEFVLNILKEKIRIKKPYYLRIISNKEENLKNLKQMLIIFYKIESTIYKRVNGNRNTYYEMNINKKEEINKIIDLKVIPNLFKHKIIN